MDVVRRFTIDACAQAIVLLGVARVTDHGGQP